jgi:uncharacterized protein (TIGR03083 family)
MDASAHLDHLRANVADLAAAARLGTSAPVPSCPDWRVEDLVEHVGRVHRWVVRSFDADPTTRVPFVVDGDPEPGDDIVAWYDDRAAELVQRFEALDLDQVVATFIGAQPVRWWARRQAHETAVHRWDSQLAHGVTEPVDASLASDGVDEYLMTFLPRWKGKLGHVGGSIHLHCTDVDGEWFVRLDDEVPVVERVHAKGDVAARGPASDLLLLIWGRVPASQLDVVGDDGVLARWLETINVV